MINIPKEEANGWFELSQLRTGSSIERDAAKLTETLHFCSLVCFLIWAESAQEDMIAAKKTIDRTGGRSRGPIHGKAQGLLF